MADSESPSIGRVEELSGIEKADTETVREYLQRVISTADVATDGEQVIDLFLQARFADTPTLDGRERETIQSFYGQIRTEDEPDLFQETERSPKRAESRGGVPDLEGEAPPEGNKTPSGPDTATGAVSGSGPNWTRVSSVIPSGRRGLDWAPPKLQLPRGVRTALSDRISGWNFYDVIALSGLLLVGYRSYLHRLGERPLASANEGFYAAIASNMVEHGYWLVPHLNAGVHPVYFQPSVETPPLSMWLQAISMTAFGVTVFAARLSAAIATLVTAGVIYSWGRQLFDRTGAFTAAFVFLTTPYVIHGGNGGRYGTPAMVSLLFGTLFVYFMWRTVTTGESSVFVPMGVVAGAAILTSGTGAALFGLIAFPLVVRYRSAFRLRDLAKGVTATVGMVLPWVSVMLYTAPDRFMQAAISGPLLGRATGNGVGRAAGGMFSGLQAPFLEQLLVFIDPWGYLLVPCIVIGLISHVRHGREDDLRTMGFVTWYLAVVVLVVALTGTQPWAIIPAYVPAALLIGGSVTWLLDGSTEFAVALGVGIVSAVLFSFRMGELSPVSIEVSPPIQQLVLGVEMALALGGCVAILVGAYYLLHVADGFRMDPRGPSLLGVALVVLLVGVPLGTPVVGSAGGNPAQAALGTNVDAATHDGSMLFVSNATARGQPLYAFSFHADITMRNLGFQTVQDLRNGTYAMVLEEERRALEREHYVIARAEFPAKGNVTVIRFG